MGLFGGSTVQLGSVVLFGAIHALGFDAWRKGKDLGGGAGWTGRISIDVSEQLGSLLKFVFPENYRRPSDREHDLKKPHGPPESARLFSVI